MCDPRQFQTFQQPLITALRASNVFDAGRADRKIPLGPSSALRSWIAKPRREHSLGFETVQCGVKGARGGLPAGARRNFGPNGRSVSVAVQTQDGEQDDVLELSQNVGAFCHFDYIVAKIQRPRRGQENYTSCDGAFGYNDWL
jgi:hypothetical protein